MAWFSRLEQPLVRDLSLATFALFAGDLRLHEAKHTRFASLHDCFIRELKDDARPIDAATDVIVSPCDGIVGAFGSMAETRLLQAKGVEYSLEELLDNRAAADRFRNGSYVTLRLTANMYHRFHSPGACRVIGTTRIPGDRWNVNPPALARVDRVYCRNERVVIHTQLETIAESLILVAVGAILVGSVQLAFDLPCSHAFGKGQELGFFHHGSTIIVLGTPGLAVCDHIRTGQIVRMGQALLQSRQHQPASIRTSPHDA